MRKRRGRPLVCRCVKPRRLSVVHDSPRHFTLACAGLLRGLEGGCVGGLHHTSPTCHIQATASVAGHFFSMKAAFPFREMN